MTVEQLLCAAREEAVTADRHRIARDLHDTVVQRLYGEGLSLQAALAGVDDPRATSARLRSSIDGLDETIHELRMAIFALTGAGSAPGGLRGRLLNVVTDADHRFGFEARLRFVGPIETIDDTIADHLMPVLREALSNVARHAEARCVLVVIAVTSHVRLTVSDDGTGFEPGTLGGCGLANMVDRASGLDGWCTVVPGAVHGSQVTWQVPLRPQIPVDPCEALCGELTR